MTPLGCSMTSHQSELDRSGRLTALASHSVSGTWHVVQDLASTRAKTLTQQQLITSERLVWCNIRCVELPCFHLAITFTTSHSPFRRLACSTFQAGSGHSMPVDAAPPSEVAFKARLIQQIRRLDGSNSSIFPIGFPKRNKGVP